MSAGSIVAETGLPVLFVEVTAGTVYIYRTLQQILLRLAVIDTQRDDGLRRLRDVERHNRRDTRRLLTTRQMLQDMAKEVEAIQMDVLDLRRSSDMRDTDTRST